MFDVREMKDSGIEWIGEIPKGWCIKRLKFALSEPMKYGAAESGIDYEESLPRYIRITDITSNGELRQEGKLSLSEEQARGYILRTDAILFARSGATVGKTFLYQERFGRAAFAGYLISVYADTEKILSKWILYYTNSTAYWEWINRIFTQATIQNIGADKYSNMPLPVAPMEKQKKIVQILDKYTIEYNQLVADIKKQVDILEQYRQSIITEVVTMGLNTNVEMKDSGIDWIGKIPLSWETRKIGRLFTLRNEKNFKPLDEVQLLSLYTDIGVFPHGEQEERGNKAVHAEGYNIVKKNDIVVNIILAWMGAIGVSNYDGVTSPAYDVYMSDTSKVVPHYYHYVFRTKGIAGECYKYGRGIMLMRWRTYSSEFKQISVPFPPIDEQQAIADYLDDKCAQIDKIIEEMKKQIVTIEEYKKALIFEYITGKKENED